MKVISKDRGKANQRLDADEVLPVGGLYIPDTIRLISERYGISIRPSIEDVRTSGALFYEGRLIAGETKVNILEIGIYRDGISATAHDTDSADFVLNDILSWSQQALGFRQPQTKMTRIYESAVVVEFDVDIEESLSAFSAIRRIFEEMTTALYNQEISITPYRFGFSSDSISPQLPLAIQFNVERRVGVPFILNRFYSAATLQTDMHIALLQEFEKALG